MDGRSARWSAHNEAQRRRIVAAAIELYDEGRIGASVQEVGARAGVSRSVLYRQFADRRDLENAVQRHILADLWEQLGPTFTQETGRSAFHRATGVYVAWAAAHPALHEVAGLDRGADGPLQQAIGYLSDSLAGILLGWLDGRGVVLGEADAAEVDTLAYGVVGLVFSSVRRWVDRGAAVPDAARLADTVADAAWALVESRSRVWGAGVAEEAVTGPGSG